MIDLLALHPIKYRLTFNIDPVSITALSQINDVPDALYRIDRNRRLTRTLQWQVSELLAITGSTQNPKQNYQPQTRSKRALHNASYSDTTLTVAFQLSDRLSEKARKVPKPRRCLPKAPAKVILANPL
jgi:hypothetical protein